MLLRAILDFNIKRDEKYSETMADLEVRKFFLLDNLRDQIRTNKDRLKFDELENGSVIVHLPKCGEYLYGIASFLKNVPICLICEECIQKDHQSIIVSGLRGEKLDPFWKRDQGRYNAGFCVGHDYEDILKGIIKYCFVLTKATVKYGGEIKNSFVKVYLVNEGGDQIRIVSEDYFPKKNELPLFNEAVLASLSKIKNNIERPCYFLKN